jgi:hypothetical protein
MDVKLAASIRLPPRANLQKIEFAAKAVMASVVNSMVFIESLNFMGQILNTLGIVTK